MCTFGYKIITYRVEWQILHSVWLPECYLRKLCILLLKESKCLSHAKLDLDLAPQCRDSRFLTAQPSLLLPYQRFCIPKETPPSGKRRIQWSRITVKPSDNITPEIYHKEVSFLTPQSLLPKRTDHIIVRLCSEQDTCCSMESSRGWDKPDNGDWNKHLHHPEGFCLFRSTRKTLYTTECVTDTHRLFSCSLYSRR